MHEDINMPLYANLNMHKYAQNMQKYAKICKTPQVFLLCIHMHLYAQNMHKICKICKHESYMQHMQKYALPLC